jgi:hypothetical protein
VPDTGISIVWGGVAAAAVTALAAIGSARISRQIKISEFRQAWINDLRKDIADYTGVAHKWFHKFHELSDINPDDKEARMRAELVPIVSEATVIFRRIKLRFNSRDNPDKVQDDAFLQSLKNLLDISQLHPIQLAHGTDLPMKLSSREEKSSSESGRLPSILFGIGPNAVGSGLTHILCSAGSK